MTVQTNLLCTLEYDLPEDYHRDLNPTNSDVFLCTILKIQTLILRERKLVPWRPFLTAPKKNCYALIIIIVIVIKKNFKFNKKSLLKKIKNSGVTRAFCGNAERSECM